jgi:hypothetical protein
MRFVRSGVLSWSLATTVVACSGTFGTGNGADAGGDDATDENPPIQGMGSGDSGHDGTAVDAGHHDAMAAAETGAAETGTTTGGEGGGVAEAGDEGPPPGCSPGDLECSGACIPSDVHNCGTCGHDCTNLAHVAGATSCTATGACSFPATACAAGWADCDGKPDDGCETDITKPGTCGSCSNVCPANDPVCAGGTCVSGCPTGTPILCSGTCVDTTSNASDCNGCGLACPNTVTNAQPTCSASKCTFACNGGFSGCPSGTPTECVDEQHDPTNCGACGKTCPGPTSGAGQPACVTGGCTLNCSAGLTACPTVSPTECANTTNDLSNCGSCGDVCSTAPPNAQPKCKTSVCGFDCNTPGYQVCNGTSCVPVADGTNGVFVSSISGSGSTCTETAPCSSIDTAIGVAVGLGKTIIYLDKGSYGSEQVTLPTNAANITIQGGWTFSGGNWTTCNNGLSSSSVVSPPALSGMGVSINAGTWTLDTLTVENKTTASTGQSLYGVFQSAGVLSMTNLSITVAAGGVGGNGAQGTAGTTPTGMCTGTSGCTGSVAGAAGSTGAPGLQGSYSATGFAAGLQAGTGGATQAAQAGCNGTPVTDGIPYTSCGLASDGDGCGSHSLVSGSGNPGCGGNGGGNGTGAFGGGASVGVFVGGSASFSGVTVQTGVGGQGGPGGPGGTGGTPSSPTTGTPGAEHTGCANTPTGCHPGGAPPCGCSSGTTTSVNGGAAGGPGAMGGTGGAGGGGSGGDSLCYATGGAGLVPTPLPDANCTAGGAGIGGLDGTGSTASQGATGRAGTHN